MKALFFATAADWVALSTRTPLAYALDMARERAKHYGRAEVWCVVERRAEGREGTGKGGALRKVATVFRPPRPVYVKLDKQPACSCPPGEHVAACRAWRAV